MVKVSNPVFILLLALLVISGCGKKSEESQSTQTAPSIAAATPAPAATQVKGLQKSAEGLSYEELEIGDGVRPVIGQTVTIKYEGKLENGTVFDSGRVDFSLGSSDMLKGFNLGIGGAKDFDAMRVGGKRRIILPPELAYGKNGDPPKIPPNATIIFEIELVKIQAQKAF